MTKIAMLCALLACAAFFFLFPWAQPAERAAHPVKTVGVVLKAMNSEHWEAVRTGLKAAAREENVRLIVLAPAGENAYREQNKIIADLLPRVDALIVSPVNIHHSAEWLAAATERGVPVVTIDEKITGIPYVGSDNYHVGELAAAELAAALPSGAPVAIVVGSSEQDAHIRRQAGFRDYIAAHTTLSLVAAVPVAMEYSQATAAGEALFREHADLQGLFVTSGLMTLGVLEASERTGYSPHIVGVDAQNDMFAALRRGRIAAMIPQDGEEIGHRALTQAVRRLAGDTIEDSFVENEVVTK